MGKAKRSDQRKDKNHRHHDRPRSKTVDVRRRQHSQHDKTKQQKTTTGKKIQQSQLKIPFDRSDQVLLVGEGDFSFALSLAQNYKVDSIVATSYDGEQELLMKYSNVRKVLQILRGSCHRVDDTRSDGATDDGDVFTGFSDTEHSTDDRASDTTLKTREVSLLHDIDATKLSSSHRKLLSIHAPYTKIVFNFPHVGGLSTDVNRQVRANQQLLVGFFSAAKSLLATKQRPAKRRIDSEEAHDDDDGSGPDIDDDTDPSVESIDHERNTLSQGRILVTLFEGEPYTLWNIRDLVRHCGLQVIESFKFDWPAYPGYQHARTIGDITSGKDRSAEGNRKGSWRGEERDARCYVIALKDEVDNRQGGRKKRKRSGDGDDSD